MDINKALELIQHKLVAWLHALIKMLPNLLLAVLILIIGFYLSKIVSRFAKKVFSQLSHGAVITNLFVTFIYLTCIGVTLFTALSVLQLDKALTTLLAGAGMPVWHWRLPFRTLPPTLCRVC